MENPENQWQTLERFVEIRSPWLTLIGEKLKDEQEQILDYWRVEKADSVVIITIQNGQFILPKPTYRPGLGQTTLDFPGGRVLPEQTTVDAVSNILRRELSISKSDLIRTVNLSIGYLARNAALPSEDHGLFNGSYAALAQLAISPSQKPIILVWVGTVRTVFKF